MTGTSPYAMRDVLAEQASETERVEFIRKTYMHVAGSLFAFAVLEAFLLQLSFTRDLVQGMMGRWTWLIIIGLFMGVSYVANRWASNRRSMGMQYAGLGLFVAAEAIIFLPLLYIASNYYPGIITKAGILTFFLVSGLTLVAFTTRKDFSFLRGAISIGFFIILGLIVVSIVAGIQGLGIIIAGAVILLTAGAILYKTSEIIRTYPIGSHVAAALSLFASVALMFYYIVYLLMSLSGED